MAKITEQPNRDPLQSGDKVPIDRAGADGHVSLGSSAGLDAPSSGDASASQVVKGNDSRLSDSRTPTSHTHTLSQITDAGTAAASSTGDFDAAGAAAAAQSAAEATAAAALASHASDSTSVHGITDTSALVVDSDLGTAAALDVPATGDAAAGEVVKGDDTRLTDARTPTSHNHAGEDITSGTVAAARLGTMTGDSGAGGASGAVPAPAAGDAAASKFLKADGTWAAPGGGIGGSTGATDNAILRSDGTGGATVQAGGGIFLSDADLIQFEGATSSFPALSRQTTTPYLAARLADDSDHTRIVGKGFWVGSSPTEAVGVFSGLNGVRIGNDRYFQWGSGGNNVQLAGTSLALSRPADGVMWVSDGSGNSASVLSSTLVEAHTSGDTLLATESGSEHTNEGAGAEITINLPSAAAGYDFTFYVQTAQSLKIVAATGDTIRTTGGVSSTGGYIRCATPGAWIHLRSVNGTEWTERGERGTWTIDS